MVIQFCLDQTLAEAHSNETCRKNRKVKMPSSKRAVVVTGFGPFGSHKVNASSVAVKILEEEGLGNEDVELVVKELPVAYRDVKDIIPALWKKYDPLLMVHVGVSGIATELTLEQLAHNDGYDKHDIHGKCPSSSCCVDDACDQIIVSQINMEHVCQAVNSSSSVKAVVSQDPGRYLCDFSYFTSLHINRSCTAFIHVPPLDMPYSGKELAEGLRQAISAMLAQVLYQ